jgi:hypothetical protein
MDFVVSAHKRDPQLNDHLPPRFRFPKKKNAGTLQQKHLLQYRIVEHVLVWMVEKAILPPFPMTKETI